MPHPTGAAQLSLPIILYSAVVGCGGPAGEDGELVLELLQGDLHQTWVVVRQSYGPGSGPGSGSIVGSWPTLMVGWRVGCDVGGRCGREVWEGGVGGRGEIGRAHV